MAAVRVMLVDDTDHVRRLLRNLLELDGFEVVGEAAGGQEAIDRVEEVAPDVIVLDYSMPRVDGLAAARQIRALRPDIVIILYTAFLDDEVERRAEEAGVDRCLAKIGGLESLGHEIARLAGSLF